MRIIELYSGIGGMHFAAKGSSLCDQTNVVLAIDINPVCNDIYRHNFPHTNLINKNICSLTAADINYLLPDMILMSPSCQPFTRLGKQKDTSDTRNTSFLCFMKLLPYLTTVSYILIENVKGFETSETRDHLLDYLNQSNFFYEEYLINPRQFGMCNSRLRYYLLGKKLSSQNVTRSSGIIYNLPPNYERVIKNMIQKEIPKNLSTVVEHQTYNNEWKLYLVPEKYLKKYFLIMDIVSCNSKNSCCFTKGYTRYIQGTGSVLSSVLQNDTENIKKEFIHLVSNTNKIENNEETLKLINKLNLRFFTPVEISRLMMFPETFSFPEHITIKQRYKALSNSINVFVVSFLISYLVRD